MMVQECLNFDLVESDVKTMVDMVRTLLSGSRWWAPFELCEEIWKTRGIRVSESGASARIRDLRKPQYGGHTVLIQKRRGTKFYEYKLGD